MDRANGVNLEALEEEEDDYEHKNSDTESSEDDEPDPGIRSMEPNKFDILCDGVQSSMALVHTALEEMLEMKDELLTHSIPPTLLVKLVTTTGQVFRSLSDLNMPVNELIRLVRVYSTPWEEKSAALKKLHEDYESKQKQLNIAIKRLQLVDAHSKRIAKEKRVMNWEKLFAKLTSAKGHGRRWKFLIEGIKQKAKMGLEHVQEYTRALEDSSESEEEEEDEEVKTEIARTTLSDEEESEDEDEKEEEEKDESESETAGSVKAGDEEVPSVTINITQDTDEASEGNSSRAGSAKRVRFDDDKTPVIPKPLMIDESCWTSEPDYEEYLNVRVYQPTGIEYDDVKCILKYGDQVKKIKLLNVKDKLEKKEITDSTKETKDSDAKTSPQTAESKWYEEVKLNTPYGMYEGKIDIKKLKPAQQHIQISVHHGILEEMFAMATIDLTDLQLLNLRTVYAKAPSGDDNVLGNTYSDSVFDDSFSEDIDLPGFADAQTTEDDPVKDLDPSPFPLYPLQPSKTSSMHDPCGNLPLLFYWGRQLKPKTFNRQIETNDITDVVFDLTGIDLRITTKEELHREKVERATSAITFTPEPEVLDEEMIPKMEYDSLIYEHENQMKDLKNHYENQLQELVSNIQDLQQKLEEHSTLVHESRERPTVDARRVSSATFSHKSNSAGSFRSSNRTPPKSSTSRISDKMTSTLSPTSALLDLGEREQLPEFYSVPPPVLKSPVPPPNEKVKKNFRIGRPLPKWGESLPEDFFERLKLFEEESKIHKQELNEKTLLEIRETLERKLADQHKLSKKEEAMYDALKDVSLPAIFMPTKQRNIYNPRAHQYFHPTGSTDARLTQPPSMFQLPPLPKSKMSVVNLFDLGRTFRSTGPAMLSNQYKESLKTFSSVAQPLAPAPTEIRPHTIGTLEASKVDMSEHYSDEPASPHSLPDNLSSTGHEQEIRIES